MTSNRFLIMLISFTIISCSANKINSNNHSREEILFLYTPKVNGVYYKEMIIEKMAGMLIHSIPEVLEYQSYVYKVDKYEKNYPWGFYIFDLSDKENKAVSSKGVYSVKDFKEGNFYHFVPYKYQYSFSHIGFLKGDSLIVFPSINCQEKGVLIEDLFDYLEKKNIDYNKEKISTYRKNLSFIHSVDNYDQLACKQVNYD